MMTDLSRRDFLKLARNGFLYLSGTLALGGLLRFLSYESDPAPSTEYDLGPASSYAIHSRTVLSEPPAVLIHNENGFTAFSLKCTHLGCTVNADGQGFACPCHGSRFGQDGEVVHGPAKQRLNVLRVAITSEGHIKLFTV
jgi:Rieske Fe-S protein